MATYKVVKSFRFEGDITDKVAQVMRMFGLDWDRLAGREAKHVCEVEINAGDIVFIGGPSGAGKSVLLGELAKQVPENERIDLDDIETPSDKACVDCVDGEIIETLKFLSTAGLSDVFCVMKRPANLSDGEKWRFRLAMALAAGKKYIFADEFCTNLDRITAAVISHNIRKYAKKHGVTFILASVHEDILFNLEPDVIISKCFDEKATVTYKEGTR
ncbi:MAG: ATP-binding cassette domain-containing protein [Planctomycetota bacterium]